MFTFNLSSSLENHSTTVYGKHVESGSKVSIFFLRVGDHWICDYHRRQQDEPEDMLKQGLFSSFSLSWVTLLKKDGYRHFKIKMEKMEDAAGSQSAKSALCFEPPSTVQLVYT